MGMKSMFDMAGKIFPPRSVEEAEARLKQLRHESKKIGVQLEDIGRIAKYPTARAYDVWKEAAKGTIRRFQEEARQLEEWLDNTIEESALVEAAGGLSDVAKGVEREMEEQEHEKFWEN